MVVGQLTQGVALGLALPTPSASGELKIQGLCLGLISSQMVMTKGSVQPDAKNSRRDHHGLACLFNNVRSDISRRDG
jgi:hypothetical protein